jgi:elongation factor P--(R)-beta-lysine ligase
VEKGKGRRGSLACIPSILQKRDKFLRMIREFFHEKDFLEVDPPLLVPSAGMEPHLDPFIARGMETGQTYFLPTSPEFYLKKLLAAGVERVFALAPSFRDEQPSKSHSPQFLMLEWYRAGKAPEDIVEDCEEFFAALVDGFDISPLKTAEGKQLFLNKGIDRIELDLLFKKSTGKSLKELDSPEKWRKLAKKNGAEVNEKWSENDCFSFLLIEKIEKELGLFDRPVAVFGYPPFQSALAEVRKDGLIDRFEIFMGGVEIANAYNELSGKQKNIDRYLQFQGERMMLGKEPHPADEAFFEAADLIPPSAGIALGADRLLSLLLGCEIKDCQNG